MEWQAAISEAGLRIAGHVRRTPVATVRWEARTARFEARAVRFKFEQMQHTGSFKVRGAFNTLLQAEVPEAGIVAASGGLLSAGIFDRIPEYSEIWDDAPNRQRISAHTEAIVHWAHFFGLRDGDVIESELLAPDRTVLASSRHVMDRNRATEFRAAGRRRPDGGWAAGIYVGKWRLLRNGAVVAEASISTQIE